MDRDALSVVISLSSCLLLSKFWLKVVKTNTSAHADICWLPIDTRDVHNVQVLNSSHSTTHGCFAVHANQFPRSLHLILPSFPHWSCEVCLSCLAKNTSAALQESKKRKGLNNCLKPPPNQKKRSNKTNKQKKKLNEKPTQHCTSGY